MDPLNFFRIAGYVALLFGVICTIGVDYLKNKEDRESAAKKDRQMTELLNDVKESNKLLEPFNDMASKLFPGLDQPQALDKLKARIDSLNKAVSAGENKISLLSSDLVAEKKTIKSFESSVYIEFSGNWKGLPYSIWYQSPGNATYLKFSDSHKKLPDIEFSSSRIRFETLNDNTAVFKNTLAVQPGDMPLGNLTDVLRGYDQMTFSLLFTNPRNLTNPKITVRKVKITFLINGSKRGGLDLDKDYVIDLSKPLSQAAADSHLSPTFELEGNLVDLLKLSLD